MSIDWKSEIVGVMHHWNISQKCLGDELGVTNRYVSMVLTGRRNPAGAEQRFHDAIERIIARKSSSSIAQSQPNKAD